MIYLVLFAIIICIPDKEKKNFTKYYTFLGRVVFVALSKLDFLLTWNV